MDNNDDEDKTFVDIDSPNDMTHKTEKCTDSLNDMTHKTEKSIDSSTSDISIIIPPNNEIVDYIYTSDDPRHIFPLIPLKTRLAEITEKNQNNIIDFLDEIPLKCNYRSTPIISITNLFSDCKYCKLTYYDSSDYWIVTKKTIREHINTNDLRLNCKIYLTDEQINKFNSLFNAV